MGRASGASKRQEVRQGGKGREGEVKGGLAVSVTLLGFSTVRWSSFWPLFCLLFLNPSSGYFRILFIEVCVICVVQKIPMYNYKSLFDEGVYHTLNIFNL